MQADYIFLKPTFKSHISSYALNSQTSSLAVFGHRVIRHWLYSACLYPEKNHELRDSVDVIAYSLVPDKPGEREPFWTSQARTLIRTIILHTLTVAGSGVEPESASWRI